MDFQKILVATDFSDISLHAVEKALALALSNQSKLYLLHVLELPAASPSLSVMDDVTLGWEKDARERLGRLLPDDLDTDIVTQEVTRRGNPAEEIARFASEKAVDLIVVGTHGRKGLSKLLLGSTAEKLLREAPCQILVIKPHPARMKVGAVTREAEMDSPVAN